MFLDANLHSGGGYSFEIGIWVEVFVQLRYVTNEGTGLRKLRNQWITSISSIGVFIDVKLHRDHCKRQIVLLEDDLTVFSGKISARNNPKIRSIRPCIVDCSILRTKRFLTILSLINQICEETILFKARVIYRTALDHSRDVRRECNPIIIVQISCSQPYTIEFVDFAVAQLWHSNDRKRAIVVHYHRGRNGSDILVLVAPLDLIRWWFNQSVDLDANIAQNYEAGEEGA